MGRSEDVIATVWRRTIGRRANASWRSITPILDERRKRKPPRARSCAAIRVSASANGGSGRPIAIRRGFNAMSRVCAKQDYRTRAGSQSLFPSPMTAKRLPTSIAVLHNIRSGHVSSAGWYLTDEEIDEPAGTTIEERLLPCPTATSSRRPLSRASRPFTRPIMVVCSGSTPVELIEF